MDLLTGVAVATQPQQSSAVVQLYENMSESSQKQEVRSGLSRPRSHQTTLRPSDRIRIRSACLNAPPGFREILGEQVVTLDFEFCPSRVALEGPPKQKEQHDNRPAVLVNHQVDGGAVPRPGSGYRHGPERPVHAGSAYTQPDARV